MMKGKLEGDKVILYVEGQPLEVCTGVSNIKKDDIVRTGADKDVTLDFTVLPEKYVITLTFFDKQSYEDMMQLLKQVQK